jgi:hypothetical protein
MSGNRVWGVTVRSPGRMMTRRQFRPYVYTAVALWALGVLALWVLLA